MRKILFFILLSLTIYTFSQNEKSNNFNSFRLGLNFGSAWQHADYRSCYGMGGGITLEKGFHENSTNIFSFSIRGRYLAANTYGMNYHRNYDIKNNPAYNGIYDSAVNYLIDTSKNAKGYVFDNYKMTLAEGALELQLSFNRLRERTNVLLNLWAGVGITSFRTKSDLLDANGNTYDFYLVDSTGNKINTIKTYNALIDKKYESFAYGSKNGNLITFSPSAGIGLGYRFNSTFSLLWEYKITLPQGANADLLDGKLAFDNDAIGRGNDYYQYTGLNFVFSLRGKKRTNSNLNNSETVYTNSTVPTNSVSPTVSVVPNSSVDINNPNVSVLPTTQKPVISFITPPTSGFVVKNQLYKISLQILNISSKNQIQFKFNGLFNTNFTFNSQTHILEYNSTLNIGSNSIQITANNSAGSDNKSTTVIYELPIPKNIPPIVSFINPSVSSSSVSISNYQVNAQILNVTNQNDIAVYHNGSATTFSFNANTKKVSFFPVLISGKNTIRVIGKNVFGEDSKTVDIYYTNQKPLGNTLVIPEPKLNGVPPVINLINPSSQINSTNNSLYNFNLSILNVNSISDIELLFNGLRQTNFTYNVNTKELFIQTNLIPNSNILLVKAKNLFGEDVKEIKVEYLNKTENKLPPVISFSNPLEINSNSMVKNYTYKATINNMLNSNNIELKFNGISVANYSFDGLTFTYNTSLEVGTNKLEIKAVNKDGMDEKSVSVNYNPKTKIQSQVGDLSTPIDTNSFEAIPSATINPIKDNRLITICHYPPRNKENPQTITISASAWESHKIHGDILGACKVVSTENLVDTVNKKIVICHIPPGNNQNPVTISIPMSAWSAHKAHGDVLGDCTSENTEPAKTSPKINNSNNDNNKSESDSLNIKPKNVPRRPR